MNISYNWLKDLVEIDLSPRDLAKKLTSVGLAVEGVHEAKDDFVFDIDLTSNRPDCLSHFGVAREIAAFASSKVQSPKPKVQNKESENRNVSVEHTELCPRYTARIVRNVKIADSPEWLRERLEAIGQRSINNVADITNFVMHELGNPLHAFDYNKLADNKIIVRRALNGETMKTLDGFERKFDDSMLLICDSEKPVAIGGIMGGFDSGISNATIDVLIEVAYFQRDNIRQTSRKLGLSTEASYRFERGVDIENVVRASNRCVDLICEIAGGEIDENFVDVYSHEVEQKSVELRPNRITKLTGLNVEKVEVERILNALGFETKIETEGKFSFNVPSWRIDIEREEDLVEEVARHVGLDSIAEELPPAFGAGEYQPNETPKKAMRQSLVDVGFNEAISYSFIDAKHDAEFEFLPDLVDETLESDNEKFITLRDSIIEGATRMRPTLLVGLLEATRENFNFGTRNVKLFEVGKIFANKRNEDLPLEIESFALIVTGNEILANRAEAARELDFYDAKGALETAIDAMNLPSLTYKASNIKHLQIGKSADVLFKNEKVGTIGQLSNELNQKYKFRQNVF
ncbi:MAG: phenylalanine--tRNA ligase subunit beta, partial [Pyrinomonadaceae bacterium]|nr:phenylalanine--tRNA ligase subunit beta [Pyrinomonadaceae bacterium]